MIAVTCKARRSGAQPLAALSRVYRSQKADEKEFGIRAMAMANGSSNQGKKSAPTVMTLESPPSNVSPNHQNPPGILRDPVASSARKMNTDIPDILPHERVFPIQIGSELFRLSGASISSDGKYFLPSLPFPVLLDQG